MNVTRLAATLALVIGAGASSTAFAQARSWNFGDATSPGNCSETNIGSGDASGNPGYGNVFSCAEAPSGVTANLTVRAFGAGSSAVNGTNPGGTTYTNILTANVGYYGTTSGFGVGNQSEGGQAASSPNHTMDNSTTVDMLLLKFNSATALQTLKLGYVDGDSDVSVLRYTGAGAPEAAAGGSGSLLDRNLGNLLANGWSLVANVFDAGTTQQSFNASGLTSSYWLVSAFSSAYGAAGDSNIDQFKILTVGTLGSTGGNLPEPASLALAATALGFMTLRRRQQRSKR